MLSYRERNPQIRSCEAAGGVCPPFDTLHSRNRVLEVGAAGLKCGRVVTIPSPPQPPPPKDISTPEAPSCPTPTHATCDLSSLRTLEKLVGGKRCCPLARGPPTTYRRHKRLQINKGISKGVVCKLSEPKRTAKCIPPPGLHCRCSSWLLWGWCADCGVRSCVRFMAGI